MPNRLWLTVDRASGGCGAHMKAINAFVEKGDGDAAMIVAGYRNVRNGVRGSSHGDDRNTSAFSYVAFVVRDVPGGRRRASGRSREDLLDLDPVSDGKPLLPTDFLNIALKIT